MNELIYYDLKQSPGLTHSLSGQVAREIGRRIVAGHYAPRTQIEDEASLAARYGVSRSVIRDAVKVLVGKGLVSDPVFVLGTEPWQRHGALQHLLRELFKLPLVFRAAGHFADPDPCGAEKQFGRQAGEQPCVRGSRLV